MGCLYTKSQVTDYVYHGNALEDYNLLDFIKDIYNTVIHKHEAPNNNDLKSDVPIPGRLSSYCVPYHTDYPKSHNTIRAIQQDGHNTLANIIGVHLVPQNDDSNVYSYYCACMLILFKLWRELETDIKNVNKEWDTAFNTFIATASKEMKRSIAGIQHYYKCQTVGREDRMCQHLSKDEVTAEDPGENFDDNSDKEETITEEGLAALKHADIAPWEKAHADQAILYTRRAGIFSQVPNTAFIIPDHGIE